MTRLCRHCEASLTPQEFRNAGYCCRECRQAKRCGKAVGVKESTALIPWTHATLQSTPPVRVLLLRSLGRGRWRVWSEGTGAFTAWAGELREEAG